MYNYLLIGLMVFIYWVVFKNPILDFILRLRGYSFTGGRYGIKDLASGIVPKVLLWPLFAAEAAFILLVTVFAPARVLERDPRIKKS